MAWCAFKMGNPQNALKYLNQADELNEGHPDSLYIRGRCLLELGNIDNA